MSLKEINRILRQSNLSRSDIISLMVQIRIILEENNLKTKYKYLNLYCNWTVHSKISESMTCYRILEDITNLLKNYDENPVQSLKNVEDILSIPKLRQDIIDFSNQFNIDISFFEVDDTWRKFFYELSLILENKPLQFPEIQKIIRKKNRLLREENMLKIYNKMHRNAKVINGHKVVVEKIFFSLENEQDVICWTAVLDGGFIQVKSELIIL